MTPSRNPLRNCITALCGAAALIACATVLADPPGRVARLAQINGTVSFSPAGEEEWVLAQARVKGLLSAEHFSVDGTLVRAWASLVSGQKRNARCWRSCGASRCRTR